MRRELLLGFYRDFLKNNGVMYENALWNISNLSICFLITKGTKHFITSDSPAFFYTAPSGLIQGILPISPHILAVLGKKDDKNCYYISYATDEQVEIYNNAIKLNAKDFIIHYHSR